MLILQKHTFVIDGSYYNKERIMRFIILIFTFLSFTLSAQTTYTSAGESDSKALEILETIKKDYDSHPTHKFNFNIDIEYSEHEGEQFSGSLIQEGDKFSLDLGDRNIISDSETVWVYLKDRNEVQINDADFDEDSELMTPSDIFNLYNSDKYIFAVSNNGHENGESITQIECKSTDDDSEYSKIRLTIKDSGNEPVRAKLFFKDGSRLTMVVTDHVKSYSIPAGAFSFDTDNYADVTIEDLRF